MGKEEDVSARKAGVLKKLKDLGMIDENRLKNLANVGVEFKGDKILIPEGLEVGDAIMSLISFEESQEREVSFVEQFKVFPWDGAHALGVVLNSKFGWVDAAAIRAEGNRPE